MELAYVDEDHAPGNKLAGGLRVKTLHNYEDTTHAKLLGRKVYTYRDGQLSIEPCGFLNNTLLIVTTQHPYRKLLVNKP